MIRIIFLIGFKLMNNTISSTQSGPVAGPWQQNTEHIFSSDTVIPQSLALSWRNDFKNQDFTIKINFKMSVGLITALETVQCPEVSTVLEYQILTGDARRKCDNLAISAGDSVLGFIITNTVNTNEPLVPGYWLWTMLTLLLVRTKERRAMYQEGGEIYVFISVFISSLTPTLWVYF